jgi:hypothetical protein
VIDVEEAELAVEELLRRGQLGVILVEPLHVRLHDEHPHHAGRPEQHQQHDAEADGAELKHQPVNQGKGLARLGRGLAQCRAARFSHR